MRLIVIKPRRRSGCVFRFSWIPGIRVQYYAKSQSSNRLGIATKKRFSRFLRRLREAKPAGLQDAGNRRPELARKPKGSHIRWLPAGAVDHVSSPNWPVRQSCEALSADHLTGVGSCLIVPPGANVSFESGFERSHHSPPFTRAA